MRRARSLVLAVSTMAGLCCSGAAYGQDGTSPEQLRRMYDDAITNLKTAQERRNELARKNEELAKRIAQLEEELAKTAASAHAIADKTYQIRAERAAFTEFLRTNPEVNVRWQAFLQRNLLEVPASDPAINPHWPLPDATVPEADLKPLLIAPATRSTTQPSTAPTTVPTTQPES